MSNMDYCMWENTSRDLTDAREKVQRYLDMSEDQRNEEHPSTYEIASLRTLLDEARQIAEMEMDIEDLYEELIKRK